jgi:hypothetical protein
MNKESQSLEQGPDYVAEQIYSIMRIMVTRMPYESWHKSFSSLAEKINDINSLEVSNKQSPGGAAIGVSISLVKNILNGRDPYFIRLVLDNLIKKISN